MLYFFLPVCLVSGPSQFPPELSVFERLLVVDGSLLLGRGLPLPLRDRLLLRQLLLEPPDLGPELLVFLTQFSDGVCCCYLGLLGTPSVVGRRRLFDCSLSTGEGRKMLYRR